MGKLKKNHKRKNTQIEVVPKDELPPLPAARTSDEPVPKKVNITLFYTFGFPFKFLYFSRNDGPIDKDV